MRAQSWVGPHPILSQRWRCKHVGEKGEICVFGGHKKHKYKQKLLQTVMKSVLYVANFMSPFSRLCQVHSCAPMLQHMTLLLVDSRRLSAPSSRSFCVSRCKPFFRLTLWMELLFAWTAAETPKEPEPSGGSSRALKPNTQYETHQVLWYSAACCRHLLWRHERDFPDIHSHFSYLEPQQSWELKDLWLSF